MQRGKKKKDQRLRREVIQQEDFLIRRLREEWENAERHAKGEAFIRQAKASSVVVGKTLLMLLLLAGTVAVAVVAPNILAAVGRMTRRRVFFEKAGMQKAQEYLRKKKLITFSRDKNGHSFGLTEKGRVRALFLAFQDVKIRVQPEWDGIWRVVIFDIPDKKKWSRDTFRKSLRDIGFLQMQKSVFISPYPCEEEVALLTAVCDAAGHVRLIRTSELTHDHDIRDAFLLS